MKRGDFKVYGPVFIEDRKEITLFSEHRTRALAEKAIGRYVSMSRGKKTRDDFEIREERTRQSNPRGAKFDQVRSLYRNFREREPTRVLKVTTPRTPRALAVMGYLRGVSYDTTHGNRAVGYDHTFKAGSRPLLATDGKRLYILQGRYRVTSRGIVDLDSDGREQN